MKTDRNAFARSTNRRAFFKNGAAAAGAATLGGSLLKGAPLLLGRTRRIVGRRSPRAIWPSCNFFPPPRANLIMPEPCLDPVLGSVAIIRPTSTKLNGAVAAIQGFVDDGLFIGQKDPAFLNTVFPLAEQADAARREL